MKYIAKRDNFKSGLVPFKPKELTLEKDSWQDTYDELPHWKDSAVGRLLSFITRKSVEKVQGLRVNRVLNDLEGAFNVNVIDELSKNEDFKDAVNSTEKSSFFKSIFERLKNVKDKKEFEKVKDIIEEAKKEEASYVQNPPQVINILIQLIDNRTVNIETKAEEVKDGEKKPEEKKSEETKGGENKSTEVTNTKHNFISDLLNSKDPYEFIKEPNIKKQFFIDVKTLLKSDFGSILTQYLGKELVDDLNKLSIFQKSGIADSSSERDASLKKQEELKKKRQELQGKSKPATTTNQPEKKDLSKKDKIGQLQEAVENVDPDTLSLREGSIKKLIESLRKFFADKRVKKDEVANKYFSRTNKMYTEYLGGEASSVKSEESKPEDASKGDIKSLLPVLYKDLSPAEIEVAQEINDAIEVNNETGLIKYDFTKTKNVDDKFNEEINGEIKKTQDKIQNDPELEKKATDLEAKETAIDPLAIIKVFNSANKLMVTNYMPSNRSGGAVSKRVANDYETLEGGLPSLKNDNGPYRNKKIFSKWNEGVLALVKKYQARLKENKYIMYNEQGEKEIQKSKAPIVKFINDMLNDSHATGKKGQQHQTDFLESYFNIKDEYVSQYKSKYGDPFGGGNQQFKGDSKEHQTASKSGEASFSTNKSGGGKIEKIVASKMRDANAGYAFSLKGIINGYNKYEGKRTTMYCLGIKTYAKDYVLFKMSFNNDWFLGAYKSNIKIDTETEETSKTYPVFLMLLPYDAVIRDGGDFVARIMPCVPGDKIAEADIYTMKVSKTEDIKILHGKDGYMMRMDKFDPKKKTSKDVPYAKDETFNNILSKLSKKEGQ